MVDSLVGFLQSPVWSSPVNDYIEQNCVGKLNKANTKCIDKIKSAIKLFSVQRQCIYIKDVSITSWHSC